MDAAAIREEMSRLEQSILFSKTATYFRLLRFLVENAPDEGELLKEAYVGTVFFRRPADYDPRYDSIVRVNINRLRLRLNRYYETEGQSNPLRISIPRGSYSPAVEVAPGETTEGFVSLRSLPEMEMSPAESFIPSLSQPAALGAETTASRTRREPIPFSFPEPTFSTTVGTTLSRSKTSLIAIAIMLLSALASLRFSMHAIYVVTLICQATSSLILAQLAFTGQRLRGIATIAVACGLHTLAIFVLPMWSGKNNWRPEAISAALIPLFFFLIDEGLRALIKERTKLAHPRIHSHLAWALVIAAMLLVTVVAPWSQFWSMQIARFVGSVLMLRTARLLWQTKPGSPRMPALVTAALLTSIAVTMLIHITVPPRGLTSSVLGKLAVIEVTLLAFSFIAIHQAESKRALYLETRQDALTGLPNRRAMEEWAAAEMRFSERTGRPLALFMMEIDGFAELNDTYGHSFGDEALRVIGDVLPRSTPASSYVARLSGQKFIMLLPGHTLTAACQAAETVRTAIADIALIAGNPRVHLTVSIGVTMWHAGETTWMEMLRRSDAAMYRAKMSNNQVMVCEKNRVVVSEIAHGSLSVRKMPVQNPSH